MSQNTRILNRFPTDQGLDKHAASACARLEDRVLMSASPITVDHDGPDSIEQPFDRERLIAPLSIGGSDGDPSVVAFDSVVTSEDANNTLINLGDHFSDAETPDAQLVYELVSNSESSLFDLVEITDGILVLDYADDVYGQSTLVVRATDTDGNSADAELNVAALPVNDRPTAVAFSDLTIAYGTHSTVIDLFAAFDDIEDADNELIYSITSNSNPNLFGSVDIDHQSGLLTFTYAAGAQGTAEITLRATDTDGLYVEMATNRRNFNIYHGLQGSENVHYPGDTNWQNIVTFGGWAFGQSPGNADSIDVETFRWAIETYLSGDPDQLVMIDLEDPAFTSSTVAARDNLAHVLDVLREERPDLNRVGFYAILPERNFWDPFLLNYSQEFIASGVDLSWHQNALPGYQANFDEWLHENSLYRSEPLSDGSGTVADGVSVVFPSLYTFYSNSYNPTSQRGVLTEITADDVSNRFQLIDNYVVDGMKVSVTSEDVGHLPTGISKYSEYYIVNSTLDSFQLAATADGDAIDFGAATGRQYLRVASQYVGHDGFIEGWVDAYASQNLAEANKYGKETIAYLSPSYFGIGTDYLDKNFFRMQLDTVFESAEGVTIFNLATAGAAGPAADTTNHGWWAALREFEDFLDSPTQFSITVEPPDAVDQFTINEDTTLTVQGSTLLANDSFVPGHNTTVSANILPSHAQSFSVQSDGTFEYTPDANFFGTDTFSYVVTGSNGSSGPIEVTINVVPVNDAPTATGAMHSLASVGSASPLFVDLMIGFLDVDNELSDLSYTIVSNNNPAVLSHVFIGGTEGNQLVIDAQDAAIGSGSIILRVTDGAGGSVDVDYAIQVARIFAPSHASTESESRPPRAPLAGLASADFVSAEAPLDGRIAPNDMPVRIDQPEWLSWYGWPGAFRKISPEFDRARAFQDTWRNVPGFRDDPVDEESTDSLMQIVAPRLVDLPVGNR